MSDALWVIVIGGIFTTITALISVWQAQTANKFKLIAENEAIKSTTQAENAKNEADKLKGSTETLESLKFRVSQQADKLVHQAEQIGGLIESLKTQKENFEQFKVVHTETQENYEELKKDYSELKIEIVALKKQALYDNNLIVSFVEQLVKAYRRMEEAGLPVPVGTSGSDAKMSRDIVKQGSDDAIEKGKKE